MRLAFALVVLLLLATSAFAQTTLLSESFDAVTAPELPPDWSGDWTSSTSSASTGSGGNNLVDTGTGVAAITSASFSVERIPAVTLTYLARRTSSYPAEALSVVVVTESGEHPVSGAGLPTSSSSWETVTLSLPSAALGTGSVRLRFETTGGTSSGSNARIDDVLVTSQAAAPSLFGFPAASAGDVLAGTTGHLVPLRLSWSGPEDLQGLQFEFDVGSGVSVAGFLRGAALSDLGAWTVSTEGISSLAISNSQDGLSPGDFEPLLSVILDVDDLVDTTNVALTLSGVIGAKATPDGDDAGLSTVEASTTLRVLPRVGVLAIPDSVGFGSVPVGGTADEIVWIGNVGSASLNVALAASLPSFEVTPADVSIAPGDSVEVVLSFSPEVSDLGAVAAVLAANGVPQVNLTATAVAAWGDATDDGLVDVGDLVLGVDVLLGRVSPTSDVTASLDLHPFPSGDGTVDVRDLTVLTQAVLRGEWPNAIPLPTPALAGNKGIVNQPGVRFLVEESVLQVEIGEGIRALQASLRWTGSATRIGSPQVLARGDLVRVLWAPLSGETLPIGVHPVAQLSPAEDPAGPGGTGRSEDSPSDIEGTAIGSTGERIAITELDLPTSPDLRPYPNPFAPSTGASLILPGAAPVRVIDLLGRVVWHGADAWNGRSRSGAVVAPGLYFVESSGRRWSVIVAK